MPENLHDTPARFEENLKYLQDPTDKEGKPYSSKQVAANKARKSQTWLYHEKFGGRVFKEADIEAAMDDGWCEEPFVHPNNPQHQPPTVPSASAERDVLLAEAKEMGLNVPSNIGIERLRERISDAETDPAE